MAVVASTIKHIQSLFAGNNVSIGSIMAKGTTGSFVLKLSNTGLAFITSVLLARWLGASSYGEYIYAVSWMTLISVAARMGFDVISPRFFSPYIHKKEWANAKGFFLFSTVILTISSLTIMFIADVVAWMVPSDSMPISYYIFWISLVLLPASTLYLPFRGYLISIHKVVKAQLPALFINPALFVMLLVVLYFFDSKWLSVENVFWLKIFSTCVGLLFVIMFAKKELLGDIRSASAEYHPRIWLSAAIPVSLMGGMSVINMNADILMLGTMSGAEAAGIYKVATRGAELLILATNMIDITLSPVISRLYAADDTRRLQRGLTKTVRVATIVTLPVLLLLVVFGEQFMLLFGKGFITGYSSLLVLCAGQMITVLFGPSSKILVMTGREKKATVSLIASTGINITLNYLLIPRLGIIGAAIATSSSIIFMNIMLVSYSIKSLGINPTIFSRLSGKKGAPIGD